MAKRDPQVFSWKCEKGVLEIIGREDSAMFGSSRTYRLRDYPEAIRQNLADAGFKSVFQQRTSQVERDLEKLQAWDDLDAMFQAGDWEKEGGTRGAPVIAAWIEAAAESKACTPGEFQASWSKLDKAIRDRIKANCETKFAARIIKIKEGRKAETIDMDDLAEVETLETPE